ncbi:hypothetical protein GJ496_005843 [Pomphorhynchus laevis]|nr:hypothetical protein GJ496_005843 [Pomphorhynchus laevis]
MKRISSLRLEPFTEQTHCALTDLHPPDKDIITSIPTAEHVRRLHEQMHTSENWVQAKVNVSNAFNAVDRQCFIDAIDIETPSIGLLIK